MLQCITAFVHAKMLPLAYRTAGSGGGHKPAIPSSNNMKTSTKLESFDHRTRQMHKQSRTECRRHMTQVCLPAQGIIVWTGLSRPAASSWSLSCQHLHPTCCAQHNGNTNNNNNGKNYKAFQLIVTQVPTRRDYTLVP